MKLLKKIAKNPRKVFPGRWFGALTGRPGGLMKNLKTPGKPGELAGMLPQLPDIFRFFDFPFGG